VGTTPRDEPDRATIVREALLFALLVLVVGGIFVGWRVWREGPRVFHHAPHSTSAPR
jgi:hypothetical protein